MVTSVPSRVGRFPLPTPDLPRAIFDDAENLLSAGAANRTRTCDPVITNNG
jgi:hypothetical protein